MHEVYMAVVLQHVMGTKEEREQRQRAMEHAIQGQLPQQGAVQEGGTTRMEEVDALIMRLGGCPEGTPAHEALKAELVEALSSMDKSQLDGVVQEVGRRRRGGG
jgi:hypothetical protein